jgi:hypothetical protein
VRLAVNHRITVQRDRDDIGIDDAGPLRLQRGESGVEPLPGLSQIEGRATALEFRPLREVPSGRIRPLQAMRRGLFGGALREYG